MHVTVAPPRTVDQRLNALAYANEIRTRRARLKKAIGSYEHFAAAVIEDPPTWAQTMKVRNLLLAVPKLGPAKIDRALRKVSISPTRTLGGLSDRQRRDLLDYFAFEHPMLRLFL